MKHNRLLWFLILLICISLSCTLYRPGHIAGVTSVSVTPHSGSGKFQASVTGEAHLGSSLRCYIPEDNENGKRLEVEKYNRPLKYDGSVDTFNFNLSFPFSYTVPGTHTLICMLGTDSESAWNQDFVVVGGGGQPPATQPPVPQPSLAGMWQGTGTLTESVYDPVNSCTEKAVIFRLMVNVDGSAKLEFSYPAQNLFDSCKPEGYNSNYEIPGQVTDPAGGTVKFTTCGKGTAQGELTYTSGTLTGHLTCFNNSAFSYRADQVTQQITIP